MGLEPDARTGFPVAELILGYLLAVEDVIGSPSAVRPSPGAMDASASPLITSRREALVKPESAPEGHPVSHLLDFDISPRLFPKRLLSRLPAKTFLRRLPNFALSTCEALRDRAVLILKNVAIESSRSSVASPVKWAGALPPW